MLLTGVTLRPLQYWDETGRLRAARVDGPGGNGKGLRVYSEDQVRRIRLYRRIRKAGIPLGRAGKLLSRNVDLEQLAAAVETVKRAGLKVS